MYALINTKFPDLILKYLLLLAYNLSEIMIQIEFPLLICLYRLDMSRCSKENIFTTSWLLWSWHLSKTLEVDWPHPSSNITRQALTWNPQGKRKRDQPLTLVVLWPGGGRTLIAKGWRCWRKNLKRTPNRYQNPVLWVWLEIFHPYVAPILKQHIGCLSISSNGLVGMTLH